MGGENAAITLNEALGRLRAEHSGLLADVQASQRALWVGSGISRSEVPSVPELLQTILTNLRTLAEGEPPEGPHRAALRELAGGLLGLTPEQVAQIDHDARNFEIPLGHKLDALTTNYADLLSMTVGDEESDYLLWSLGQVCEQYGNDDILPGTDHYLIAMLTHERALPGIVTTNWDGLIERATLELTRQGSPPPLVARVKNADFQVEPNAKSLLKIHGCAVRAGKQPGEYRHLLVATPTALATVLNATDRAELVGGAETLAKHYRTLFLGLSLQDADLLTMLASARTVMEWPWDARHPAFVFAEQSLGLNHQNALNTVYGQPEPIVRQEVFRLSPTGMYSTPVLATLVLHVLSARLNDALTTEVANRGYPEDLRRGIPALERHIAAHVGDRFARLVVLLRGGHSAAMARFNSSNSDRVEGVWAPVATDPGAPIGGLATFYALLGLLLDEFDLTVHTEVLRAALSGTFVLTSRRDELRSSVRVAVVPDSLAADLVLEDTDWASVGGRKVMLITREKPLRRQSRDSGMLLGSARNTSGAPLEVTVEELMAHAVDATSAAAQLKEFLAI